MSELAQWLQQQVRQSQIVQVNGRDVLVRELSLAELDAIAASGVKDATIDNAEFEGRLMSASVCDPETGDPIKPDDWQFWGTLGTAFLPVRRAVISLNRLSDNGQAKND